MISCRKLKSHLNTMINPQLENIYYDKEQHAKFKLCTKTVPTQFRINTFYLSSAYPTITSNSFIQ